MRCCRSPIRRYPLSPATPLFSRFVTTAQALDEGVSKATLSKLAARGRIERVAHGVYRVPQVPADRFDRFEHTNALITHDLKSFVCRDVTAVIDKLRIN